MINNYPLGLCANFKVHTCSQFKTGQKNPTPRKLFAIASLLFPSRSGSYPISYDLALIAASVALFAACTHGWLWS